jgi:hypothetical protein
VVTLSRHNSSVDVQVQTAAGVQTLKSFCVKPNTPMVWKTTGDNFLVQFAKGSSMDPNHTSPFTNGTPLLTGKPNVPAAVTASPDADCYPFAVVVCDASPDGKSVKCGKLDPKVVIGN